MMFATPAAFAEALRDLPAADAPSIAAAAARQAVLTKPPGSLGRLEEIALFMAGWQARARPRMERARVAVFAGNHGVAARGVSAYPASVTAAMVANFQAGGAAINALAGAAGLDLIIVPLMLDRPTHDFTVQPAMDEPACLEALNAGADAIEPGLDLIVLGEMGIANSTSAAALCALSLGGTGADWAGPGTGIDAAGVAMKAQVVDRALALHAGAAGPFDILRRVGGREIAAIAGAVIAARHARVPVLLDGFICCAAIAPLIAAAPDIAAHCLAGHVSAEPGHRRLLDRLGLSPLLALDMRLGEGSGAAVAAGIVRAALAAHHGMASFAEAGIASA